MAIAGRSRHTPNPMTTVESRVSPPPAPHRMLAALLLSLVFCQMPARAQLTQLSTGENEPQNGGSVELPWQARDKFDRVRFMNMASSHFIYKQYNPAQTPLIFFPPVPPPLDSEIPVLAPLDAGPPAPQELASFVGETFYPLLGARLASDDLPKALRARIVAYRDAKVAIQSELRFRLREMKDADKDTRARQLSALAADQVARISALEADAEGIRLDLRPTGILGLPAENPATPENFGWKVRAASETPSDPSELRREAEAIRGEAYFEDGLSLQQRQLLEEVADDLEASADAHGAQAQALPGTRLIAFSPEPSRIVIPADLPSTLLIKVNGYLSAKLALKSELRDALHAAGDTFGEARRKSMARLAAVQAPRIGSLEEQAEAIRRELADIPSLRGAPPPPSLPPELTARIAAYRMHKVELLKRLRAMLVAPSPSAEPADAKSGSRPDDASSRVQSWLHDGASKTEIQPSSLKVSVAEFDRLQRELIASLNSEESGIRESLADYVRTTNAPADRKSINDLLRDFEEARQQQEIWDRYQDYQAAVLVPGLSAGQRRVLFDAGIEELGLALPGGERTR